MKKFYELKNKRFEALKNAQEKLDSKDMEGFNALMKEVEPMNVELSAMENLMAEQGKFSDNDTGMINRHEALEQQKADAKLSSLLDTARSGNDYANQFANALKTNASPTDIMSIEGFGALGNALTITGGAGEQGGFLVPIDFDDMIQLKMKEFVRLSDLFNVEEVSTHSGWRAVETTASRTALDKISELSTIPKSDGPRFKKVEYTIDTYGDRIPTSNELLSDNTVGLLQYLANWFGPRVVVTENIILLQLLNGLVPKLLTTGKEVAELKSALNKGLNTAHSKMAKILANQSSYDVLDQSNDTNGRGLLVPNPADQDVFRFKQRPVIMADDDLIPNGAGGELPLYVGDFKSFGTLFRRQAFEFASTKIGGDAWATNSTEIRGITRMDAKKVDETAATLLHIASGTSGFAAPMSAPFMASMEIAEALPLEERFTIEELTQLAQLLAQSNPETPTNPPSVESDGKEEKPKK